jgi:DNA-binding transcriptional LysR family regulator
MRPDPMTEWIGLELRHLAALRAIADEGSFKGAARVLGYTPSAISQQIASLERIVGTEVVAREQGRKALGPTEAGRILLSHLDAIVARLNAAKVDVEDLAKGVGGHLRIGAYESVGVRIMPEVIRRFLAGHSKMRIEVVDASIDLDLLRSLERGILDLAFTTPPIPAGPFESRTVLHDPWVLVAQRGSEYVDRGAPRTPAELAGMPLIGFRSARALDRYIEPLRDHGVALDIVLRSDHSRVIHEFVAAGLGVALMPLLAVNTHDPRTDVIDLEDLIPPREIAIAWHTDRGMTAPVEEFADLVVEIGSAIHGGIRRIRPDESAPAFSGKQAFTAVARS